MTQRVQSRPSRARASLTVKQPKPGWFMPCSCALFFAGYYLFLIWFAEPKVQYFGRPVAFLFDKRFFKNLLIRPGGLVEYVSAGLYQCYQWNYLGAAITTLLALLLTVGAWLLLRSDKRTEAGTLSLWPAVALLVVQRQYAFAWMETSLALVCAMLLAGAYAWLPARSVWGRGVLFLALSLAIYPILAGAYLVFAFYCGLVEALTGRRYLFMTGLWVCAAVVPLGGALLFAVHPAESYLLLLPFGLGTFSTVKALLPYVALPLALGVATLTSPPAPSPAGNQRKRAAAMGARWGLRLRPALLVILAVASVSLGWNGNSQRIARINCLAHDRQWEQVLEEAGLLSAYTPAAVAQINRALCQTGRLPGEMFNYPQSANYDLWLSMHKTLDPNQCMVASDLLFELGQVNRAERMAGEALELNGYLPEVLRRLADVEVLKGEPEAARIFLNLLAKTPFHGKWADERRRELAVDPGLSKDPELRQVRLLALREDSPFAMTTEPILLQCLRQNHTNRMAFEYLMAHFLLNRDLENFVHYLGGAKVFKYPEIPKHYEEALVLAQGLKGAALNIPDINGKMPGEEATRKYERFRDFMRSKGNNPEVAKTLLSAEFGNTYWYYFAFGGSSSAFMLKEMGTHR